MKRDLPERPVPADLGGYRPQLLRYARRFLRDEARAEDAVQETLAAAIEALDSYVADASLGTWLTGILRHKMVDCVRTGYRERWVELDDEIPAVSGDPEQSLRRGRFFEMLERLLKGLPAHAAQVFVLRDVIGKDTAETSAALEISENHCCVLLHRARSRLRVQLAACGYCAGESG